MRPRDRLWPVLIAGVLAVSASGCSKTVKSPLPDEYTRGGDIAPERPVRASPGAREEFPYPDPLALAPPPLPVGTPAEDTRRTAR